MQIRLFKNAYVLFYSTQTNQTEVSGIKDENGELKNTSFSTSSSTGARTLFAPFALDDTLIDAKATNDLYDFNAYNCVTAGSTSITSITKTKASYECTLLIKVTAGETDAVFSKFYFFTPYRTSGSSVYSCLQWCIDIEEEVTVPAGTSKDFSYTLKWA